MIKEQADLRGDLHESHAAARKAGTEAERNAIKQEAQLLLHEVPDTQDLHYIMGYKAAAARLIAHIERRK